ncbi:hypothetical protein [Aeromicrobium sp. CTD01-1L150]|uniref:hypothetical protein n=1 Tax=Aeromicrobium sp. CTD01-1L150 TaxID=3341830 RepID=UPI0035C12771
MSPQDPPPGGPDQPNQPPAGGTPPPPPPPPGGTPPPPPGGTPPPPPGGPQPPPPGGGVPPGGYGPPAPRDPDIGAGFSWAWAKFQQNAATLILSTLILFAIAFFAYLLIYVPLVAAGALSSGPTTYDPYTNTYETSGPSGFAVFLIIVGVVLLVFLLAILLQGLGSNLVRMSLLIADGGQPEISDLFRFPRGAATWTTAILLALGTGIGVLLCFIPGIIFAWGAAFTYFIFYDREVSPVEAIKGSFALFRDRFGPALVAVLLGGLVAGAGSLACGIGVIVTAPIGQLFIAHQFRSLTGGHIAP